MVPYHHIFKDSHSVASYGRLNAILGYKPTDVLAAVVMPAVTPTEKREEIPLTETVVAATKAL